VNCYGCPVLGEDWMDMAVSELPVSGDFVL